MKNKAVIVTVTEVSFAGEILYGQFKNDGIIFKLSDKSGIKIWIPLTEINRVVLPDLVELRGNDLRNLFSQLDRISEEYRLEEA